jgi:hypothetical protein
MSANLKELLKSLNVEDQDAIYAALTSETPNTDAVKIVLKASQTYAKPFIETELSTKFGEERKTLKGKYFKDAAQKVNKIFGNKLTNKELEDVMGDPENEGKTFDAVAEAIKTKVSEKTGTGEAELQKMLDLANGKISEYEQKLIDTETKHKADFENFVQTGKLTTSLKKELVKIMTKVTSMDAEAAAELIMTPLGQKALIKLNDKEGIDLFDLSNPESKLKKSDTEFQTLEGLATDLAKQYKLPEAQSGGAVKVKIDKQGNEDKTDPNENILKNSGLSSAEKVFAALEAANPA